MGETRRVAKVRPYELEGRSTRALLADWAQITRALRGRGVIRTNNNPISDNAKAIVSDHYGGERGGFSQRGWDVRTPSGERLQVKSLREGPPQADEPA